MTDYFRKLATALEIEKDGEKHVYYGIDDAVGALYIAEYLRTGRIVFEQYNDSISDYEVIFEIDRDLPIEDHVDRIRAICRIMGLKVKAVNDYS